MIARYAYIGTKLVYRAYLGEKLIWQLGESVGADSLISALLSAMPHSSKAIHAYGDWGISQMVDAVPTKSRANHTGANTDIIPNANFYPCITDPQSITMRCLVTPYACASGIVYGALFGQAILDETLIGCARGKTSNAIHTSGELADKIHTAIAVIKSSARDAYAIKEGGCITIEDNSSGNVRTGDAVLRNANSAIYFNGYARSRNANTSRRFGECLLVFDTTDANVKKWRILDHLLNGWMKFDGAALPNHQLLAAWKMDFDGSLNTSAMHNIDTPIEIHLSFAQKSIADAYPESSNPEPIAAVCNTAVATFACVVSIDNRIVASGLLDATLGAVAHCRTASLVYAGGCQISSVAYVAGSDVQPGWTYPIQTDTTLYVQQVYEAQQADNILTIM